MRMGWTLIAAGGLGLLLAAPGSARARDLAVQGGPGGGPFRIACGVNDFFNSMTVNRGAWVDAITANCGGYSKATHELLPARNTLPLQGGAGGVPSSDVCPQHTYVSGLRYGFTREGNRPKYLDFVEFACTPIPAAGRAGGLTAARCLDSGNGCWTRHPSPGSYNGYGLEFQSRCAANEAVSGLVGRKGQYVDALGAVCTVRPE